MEGQKKGLVVVNTGNGKGKTTAALGTALRAWGQGLKVLVLQFIKGGWKYGELKAAERLGEGFEIRQMGEGFIKGPQDNSLEEHRRAAREALSQARREIFSGKYDLIVLDEILYAVHYGLVELSELLNIIKERPSGLHLILTGRYAPPEIIEAADLVTEMVEVKHPFASGLPAQKGIEY